LNVRERIQSRLDEISKLLETQSHIHAPELVTEKIESVAKFWTILSEEEREFIAALRIAKNDQIQWKV
jgi:hypothetical protein